MDLCQWFFMCVCVACICVLYCICHCIAMYGKVRYLETANHLSCGHHRHLMVDKFLTHDYHVVINQVTDHQHHTIVWAC